MARATTTPCYGNTSVNGYLSGGDGNDLIAMSGVFTNTSTDTIEGGEGNDTIEAARVGTRLPAAPGPTGCPTRGRTAAVSVNLATNAVSGGHAAGDTLTDANATLTGFQSDFEQVEGSTFADTLTGEQPRRHARRRRRGRHP